MGTVKSIGSYCCCQSAGSTSDVSGSSTRPHPPIVVFTYLTSATHAAIAIISIVLGVISSKDAVIWMAHRVAPIWSGAFFLLTAGVGVATVKKRTSYLVMCYGALCVVSMVVGVVCIQLLKRGLVTHLSDGATYRQESLEINIILAMATCGLEILVCIMTFPVCCKMAAMVKKEVHMKRDGTFSIQILGDKDIIIQQSDSTSYERLYEDDTVSDLARLASRGECSDLIIATTGLLKPPAEAPTSPTSTTKPKLDFSTVVKMTRKSDIPCKEELHPHVLNGMPSSLDNISGVV